MENCIFCKIMAREIPGHVLYEDEHVLVFLDISQTTKGHTLIVPKAHRTDVFEMAPEEMAQVFSIAPKIATALQKTFNCTGMNIVNNNGSSAGQTVFHYHVHLIPRYNRDEFGIRFINNMEDYDSSDLAALKENIVQNLEA
ncbi:MAG: HIT family protein [Turicibacter sp.]|nr:HIT family protein [Turicibacter sp.]